MEKDPVRRFALVREIPRTFDRCIKPLENPQMIDADLARFQHREYCNALSRLGLELIVLPADDRYPDCAFVEDTAVVVKERAIVTRPGAASRRGEVEAVRKALEPYRDIQPIRYPGTLEGGDVLVAEDRLYVGLTGRTNLEGYDQLKTLLEVTPRRMIPVPMGRTLHLKTACNYLGNGLMVVNHLDFSPDILSDFQLLMVDPAEARKLSFLPVEGSVLLPDDCPRTQEEFERRGWRTIGLGLSEIRKAQAGLTCMSILFHSQTS
jgi:dimethylargininase